MKIALVHDWLVGEGGGEKVLRAILELYPAPIYTLIQDKKKVGGFAPVYSSFLQRLPFAARYFRHLLPLFPKAIEGLDLKPYDLILSSSHAVAKGVRKYPGQRHICYCHTPMRYAWDLHDTYVEPLRGLKRWAAIKTLNYLREWDVENSKQVDHFISNSRYVAERIRRIYGKEAEVIYPPVATHRFQVSPKKENYYITLSRLVPYKRIDLIVEAFSQMPDKELLVIGEGPEEAKLKAKASKNIHFLGHQKEVGDYLSRAKAFVFAAEEDFGIVPVEAQAAGIPVIAYGKGGALETVLPNKTGLFFPEQTIPALCTAITAFESIQDRFDPYLIKAHAEQFNEARFKEALKASIARLIS